MQHGGHALVSAQHPLLPGLEPSVHLAPARGDDGGDRGRGGGDGGHGGGRGDSGGIGQGEGEGEGQGLEHWGHWSSVMKLYSGPIGLSPAQLAVHEPVPTIIAQVTP